jgi:hypothetical protein
MRWMSSRCLFFVTVLAVRFSHLSYNLTMVLKQLILYLVIAGLISFIVPWFSNNCPSLLRSTCFEVLSLYLVRQCRLIYVSSLISNCFYYPHHFLVGIKLIGLRDSFACCCCNVGFWTRFVLTVDQFTDYKL